VMPDSISPKHYEAIRELVHRRAGIALGESKQALVQARLTKRLRTLDLPSYEAYLDLLSGPGADDEIVHLLDAISTNFTSFFREGRHFELLTEIVREAARAGHRKFRLWCAAAATGEEPYTLSMVCQEAAQGTHLDDIRILATDISTRALDKCREGVYETSRLDSVPEDMRKRWWDKVPEGWSAKPSLRAPLSFARMNLAEVPYSMKGPFDVIFCRNVMIYFDKEGRGRFVKEAHRLLRPRGWLFVGSSESLAGVADGFQTEHPSVYRREAP